MNSYLYGIWDTRYFWVHLALSDLRAKWRRSFFGILWSIIQPLGMALILAFVFSRLLHTDISHYAPYIFSGVIVWEFIIATTTGGALSFVQADPYIRQCRHPLAIYTLRTVLSAMFILMLATMPLLIWVILSTPQNINTSWLAILSIYPLLLLIAWPLATLLSYVGVRFRDLTPALALLMQVLWFISPVYFEEKMFREGGLGKLVDYNPIYHLLQIIRQPLLHGQWPATKNYLFCFATSLVLISITAIVGRQVERKVIFYL